MARPPLRSEKTNDPAVILDVFWREGVLYFQLVNRGDAPVRDVRVAFRRKVMGVGGEADLGQLPLWSKLAFMPAGKVIEVPIDRAPVFLARDRGTPLAVSIQYRDAEGKNWIASIAHDFTAYASFPEFRIR